MTDINPPEALARELVAQLAAPPRALVRTVTALAGDASSRSFFRVAVESQLLPRSLIMIEYGGAKGPKFPGAKNKTQEEALFELAEYFYSHRIPVAKLFSYSPTHHAFLFEDLGNLTLAQFADGTLDDDGERVKDRCGSDYLSILFQRAIDAIARLQALPFDPHCVAFQRGLAFENYKSEVSEFIEFFAEPRGISSASKQLMNKVFDGLCETVVSFPRALSHFDFHGYNIMVDEEGRVLLIDYQDACLVSNARDVVSLLNDRDMDVKLGATRHAALLRYFAETLKVGSDFTLHYNLTLLHWDLRVAGRFVKLCKSHNTERYLKWLPGTLRRLGRTLHRSYRALHGLDDLLEVLIKLAPETAEGVQDPWPLPF